MADVKASGEVRPVIGAYSPNIRWGRQMVEVQLKQWDYAAEFIVGIGGNCIGFDVLEAAIGSVIDHLSEGVDASQLLQVKLKNADGGELLLIDEEDDGEAWLRPMVVSVRIVDWIPPTLNEVRAKNGAPPVDGGDCPWRPL
ncbi:MAG: DUF5406 family protein [Pseudomonadota bacterium]